MKRDKLFNKYYKSPFHDYEIKETLSYADDTGRIPDVCFVYSGRNRGKSFEVASQLIADAWYDDKHFAYIRRYDATNFDIEDYFADKRDFIMDMTDGKYCGITRDRGKLLFYSEEEEEESGDIKRIKGPECGRFFSVSRQANVKSLQFPKIYNALYEEVLTDQSYISAEPEKVMNLYSTLRRNKEDFRLWLIWKVFRNSSIMFNDAIRGESDEDIDLVDVIASLHNLLYESVNGEPYDYMFHWANKEGAYCKDDLFDYMEDDE